MNRANKLLPIYETLADITLKMLEKRKDAETTLNEQDHQMISATLMLYRRYC